jgi:pyridoxal phosphate enzyme (YggS family)
MQYSQRILSNYRSALQKITKPDVELIVVTKQQVPPQILPLLQCGHLHFAENRLQEAASKWPELKLHYPEICLHFIGKLQKGHVRDVLQLFDVIESVDNIILAEKISRESLKSLQKPICYIQVNIGEERQKSGIAPFQLDEFVRICRDDLDLNIQGLMCIPPQQLPPSPFFTELAEMARRNHLAKLSMGMSGDFEEAIACGATQVRLGRAIFEG